MGIRKIISSGNYEASKRINGILTTKVFSRVSDAIRWRKISSTTQDSPTSKHQGIKFKEAWDLYEEMYFGCVERSTQEVKRQKINVFKHLLDPHPLSKIDPPFIDNLVKKCKAEYIKTGSHQRFNFNKPLGELKAVLSWYRENYDYTLRNPVLKRHYTLGIIKKIHRKEKVMNQSQLVSFIKALSDPTFQDFAIIQFFCASRFGEIAGIQLKNIDLLNKTLLIKEVVVENRSKQFLELKAYPKNGYSRAVSINSDIFEMAIRRRLANNQVGCNYLFHIDGIPIRYRRVQHHYNKALKKVGLFPDFSATHFVRYTMATESRRVMGSLDAAQAITGHHSVKMAEHYAKLPTTLQAETIQAVGIDLKKSWE